MLEAWAKAARRLPRIAWWGLGATIALSGAVAARLIADRLPPDQRIPLWLVGGALIFLGLAVLSAGSGNRSFKTDGGDENPAAKE